MNKYYFVTFTEKEKYPGKSELLGNIILINKHPIIWGAERTENGNFVYYLLGYKELSREEFEEVEQSAENWCGIEDYRN